jgi:phosphate transport system permease protein
MHSKEHLGMPEISEQPKPAQVRRVLGKGVLNGRDRLFFGITSAASYFAFILVGLILVFLVAQAWPALQEQGLAFVYGDTWEVTEEKTILQIGPMLYGSVLIALLGVLIATPLAIATAYMIVFILPGGWAKLSTNLIDLRGVLVFTPIAQGWAEFLHQYLGWIPLFAIDKGTTSLNSSPFIAGWIVAVMIVPIITSVTREIFSQFDRELINGALALGASRFTVFRRVILPTTSGGITGGVLLGLGRAIGETVAIYYVLQLSMNINLFQILEPRGGAIASWILSRFGEATEKEFQGLMAAGLVIFIATLIINLIANAIVNRAQPWRK